MSANVPAQGHPAPKSTRAAIATSVVSDPPETQHPWWSRERYSGALLFNIASSLLPALYATLTKLWIANIDSSLIATTETYVYIGTVVEVINEGLPRAAYKIIGDKARQSLARRIALANTLVAVQCVLGLVLSACICAAAREFAAGFVPGAEAQTVQYVRIAAWSAVAGAVDVAVSAGTRSLDRPDVPLVISSVKTALNIVLDLLFLSNYRVTEREVDAITQVVIRLLCDALGALAGLIYYLWLTHLLPFCAPRADTPGGDLAASGVPRSHLRPTAPALKRLAKPGAFTFAESAIRNAIYLWLVSGLVSMGPDWATAWSIFNTIRWGLVMVPVYALEQTSLTFTGHAWGAFKATHAPAAAPSPRSRLPFAALLPILRPALTSTAIALAVEIPLLLVMTFATARPFARYLSNSEEVARIVEHMWRTIDWCYVFYAVGTMLASVLLAAKPKWYLAQSVLSNLLWSLPWAVVVGRVDTDGWKWYGLVFGGALVVGCTCGVGVLGTWVWRVRKGWGRGARREGV